MARTGRDIIVIGASAGGLDALDSVVGQLPADLPAAIFIVQHMAPEITAEPLLRRLRRHKSLDCKLAENGEAFRRGSIYIAPPDHHLLVKRDRLLVTKGARENRARPGIDPLFRSAAVSHSSKVIGVVLTGMLDDGTAGLIAIDRCGGITVVQEPSDAAYPGMPRSALSNLEVDHCVPIAGMGALLATLARQRPTKGKAIPNEVRIEAEIAERVLSDVAEIEGMGQQIPYNCPNCGGVLWELGRPAGRRYRCHTGHSFTVTALLASQTEKIEETLWISLRMFEERKNLLNSTRSPSARRRAKETQTHIDRIKAILLDPRSWQNTMKNLTGTEAGKAGARPAAARSRKGGRPPGKES